jgi:hypothetical protein
MGEGKKQGLRVHFDGKLRLEFHGATITSDAGLFAYRELVDVLGLTAIAESGLRYVRFGKNTQHSRGAQLRQSVFSGLAGYEDTNDAERFLPFTLAYNLGNVFHHLALPKPIRHWTMTIPQTPLRAFSEGSTKLARLLQVRHGKADGGILSDVIPVRFSALSRQNCCISAIVGRRRVMPAS